MPLLFLAVHQALLGYLLGLAFAVNRKGQQGVELAGAPGAHLAHPAHRYVSDFLYAASTTKSSSTCTPGMGAVGATSRVLRR
jgi:hypothetical protein